MLMLIMLKSAFKYISLIHSDAYKQQLNKRNQRNFQKFEKKKKRL